MMVRLSVFNKFRSKTLSFRENCNSLFNTIQKKYSPLILMDFKEINFVSHSFIDEYFKLKKQIKYKWIIEYNKSLNVNNMFNLVRKNHSKKKDSTPSVKFNKLTFL